MIKEAIDRVLALAPPNIHTVGDLDFTDKKMELIYPPGRRCRSSAEVSHGRRLE